MTMKTYFFASLITLASLCSAWGQTLTIPVAEDVMSSAFFQGENRIRGYANEEPVRETHRVSSNQAFGTGPETVYLTFDYDFPTELSGPVQSATLQVTSVPGGFGAEATAENPYAMAAHGLASDPLTTIIDDTNPSGTVAWDAYFDSHILDPHADAITTVTGIGQLQFDVTDLVNQWISGANSVHAIALSGKIDTLSNGNVLHGLANNSATADVAHQLTLVVPEPSTCGGLILAAGCLLMLRRKRA